MRTGKIPVRRPAVLTSAAVALLLAVAPNLHAQTPNGDINFNRLTEAVKAIGENQLSRAEELLNAVLTTSPNDADALNLLGVVRAKQSRATEAERLFRRALARSPAHLSAHLNLGELLLNNNRPAEATPILLRAHKLAPARAEISLISQGCTLTRTTINRVTNICGSYQARVSAKVLC